MIIPKDKIRNKRKEKLKEKVCQFPGCDKIYYGTGKSCFCQEHRLKKYRKIIDQKKHEEDIKDDNNQLIKHDFYETYEADVKCSLDGCEKFFRIKIVPRVYVYPKYCPEHVNEWKRKMFSRNQETISK